MQAVSVVSVGDINPLIPRRRVGIDSLRSRNRVLPLFLHLGMHHKEGVVGEMNRDLAFVIRTRCVLIVVGDNFADAKFAGHTEGQTIDSRIDFLVFLFGQERQAGGQGMALAVAESLSDGGDEQRGDTKNGVHGECASFPRQTAASMARASNS